MQGSLTAPSTLSRHQVGYAFPSFAARLNLATVEDRASALEWLMSATNPKSGKEFDIRTRTIVNCITYFLAISNVGTQYALMSGVGTEDLQSLDDEVLEKDTRKIMEQPPASAKVKDFKPWMQRCDDAALEAQSLASLEQAIVLAHLGAAVPQILAHFLSQGVNFPYSGKLYGDSTKLCFSSGLFSHPDTSIAISKPRTKDIHPNDLLTLADRVKVIQVLEVIRSSSRVATFKILEGVGMVQPQVLELGEIQFEQLLEGAEFVRAEQLIELLKQHAIT